MAIPEQDHLYNPTNDDVKNHYDVKYLAEKKLMEKQKIKLPLIAPAKNQNELYEDNIRVHKEIEIILISMQDFLVNIACEIEKIKKTQKKDMQDIFDEINEMKLLIGNKGFTTSINFEIIERIKKAVKEYPQFKDRRNILSELAAITPEEYDQYKTLGFF